MKDFWTYVAVGAEVLWLAGASFFVIWLGVFSPRPLRAAPLRESTLSLPVIGAVLILYYLMVAVTISAGSGLGWIQKSDFGPASPPAATLSATTSAGSSSASGPSSGPATRATASAPPERPPSARKIVVSAAVDGAARILTVIGLILVIPRLFKERYAGWGLHIRQAPGGLWKGIFGFLVTYPLLVAFMMGLGLLYSLFRHEMSEHPTFEALQQHIPVYQETLLCVVAIVVAPIAEEVFFRGIVQTTLMQYSWGLLIPQVTGPVHVASRPRDYRPSAWHRWGAIVITSVAFAALHQWDQAPVIFVLSLGLGYVYERTGNLWAPIVLHLAFNSTEIAQFFGS